MSCSRPQRYRERGAAKLDLLCAAGCDVSLHAADELADQAKLVLDSRNVDHERSGVVGVLTVLLQSSKHLGETRFILARLDERQVEQMLDSGMCLGLEVFSEETGTRRMEGGEVDPPTARRG